MPNKNEEPDRYGVRSGVVFESGDKVANCRLSHPANSAGVRGDGAVDKPLPVYGAQTTCQGRAPNFGRCLPNSVLVVNNTTGSALVAGVYRPFVMDERAAAAGTSWVGQITAGRQVTRHSPGGRYRWILSAEIAVGHTSARDHSGL